MALHPTEIDLSLERIQRLLAKLGDPHKNLPPVIHVAGTNGKGSLIAYLRAIFEAADYKVHAYTSPHLVTFHERILVAGSMIEEEPLANILDEIEQVNDGEGITFFEATTVAAFLAFHRTAAEVVLLETGLGGRLDATNLIECPALTVLTPIDLDHQMFLGETIGEIAGEKAGIIKPGVPCVSAAQAHEATMVILEKVAELGASMSMENLDWRIMTTPEGFTFQTEGGTYSCPHPGLVGDHQYHNAGLAAACVDALNGVFEISDSAVESGIRDVEWPARLQQLAGGVFADMLPEKWELWLDGGHNPAAGAMLAHHCSRWRDKPLYLICGMLNTKDPVGFLKPLADHADFLYAVPVPGEGKSLTAEQTLKAARSAGLLAKEAKSVKAAIKTILEDDDTARILICGSLYLAGAVLAGAA